MADNSLIGRNVAAGSSANRPMRDVPINRIMTTSPATVGPDDSVLVAKKVLESGDIHHLPVVKDDKLVGIISSTDLLKFDLVADPATSLAKVKVRQLMIDNPVVLESSANLRDAASNLSKGGYHALPVIEPDRTLVGIVTSSDLVDHLLRQIPSGDGSLQPRPDAASAKRPDDSAILMALRQAKELVESEGRESELAQVLLYVQDRNRLLQEACKAADLYIRSGQGEHEHSVLVKCLADLKG